MYASEKIWHFVNIFTNKITNVSKWSICRSFDRIVGIIRYWLLIWCLFKRNQPCFYSDLFNQADQERERASRATIFNEINAKHRNFIFIFHEFHSIQTVLRPIHWMDVAPTVGMQTLFVLIDWNASVSIWFVFRLITIGEMIKTAKLISKRKH